MARSFTLTWDWSTLDHFGHPVTPTGFTVEREIGAEDWVLLTYTIPQNGRSYTDVLDQSSALAVFGGGTRIAYRVKVYWIV